MLVFMFGVNTQCNMGRIAAETEDTFFILWGTPAMLLFFDVFAWWQSRAIFFATAPVFVPSNICHFCPRFFSISSPPPLNCWPIVCVSCSINQSASRCPSLISMSHKKPEIDQYYPTYSVTPHLIPLIPSPCFSIAKYLGYLISCIASD
jgi:hypothetical protein